MSEDAPQFPPADESQRIEDPEKARVMAEAEDPRRTEATYLENASRSYFQEAEGNVGPWHEGLMQHSIDYREKADEQKRLAVEAGEEAGAQYDAEQADSLGSAAVEATQIPVTVDDERVQDPEKAYAMATAAADERVEAADHRRKAREQRDFSPESENPSVIERYAEENEVIAEQADKRAQEIEAWAGILHEHPVSDAYKEEHPDVDFSPRSLVQLEKSVEDDRSVVEKIRDGIKSMNVFDIPGGIQLRPPNNYDLSINGLIHSGAGNREEYNQLHRRIKELSSNGSTTIDELRDFYKEVVELGAIRLLENRQALANKVLEDIRSGRASGQSSGS